VLRQLMESGEVHGGLLSGLSHPRLRNALVAMHEAPAQEWTLDELANTLRRRSARRSVRRQGSICKAGACDWHKRPYGADAP